MPDAVPALVRGGLDVIVQTGAGAPSLATDAAYIAAGARVVDTNDAAEVDVLLHVRPLPPAIIAKLRPGTITLGFCSPSSEPDSVRALRDAAGHRVRDGAGAADHAAPSPWTR